MWVVQITPPNQSPFRFEYWDVKDYRAFQKFWGGRKSTCEIEFLGWIDSGVL